MEGMEGNGGEDGGLKINNYESRRNELRSGPKKKKKKDPDQKKYFVWI